MRKRKVKWMPEGPEPGDYMVDVYDTKGENVVDQKCFGGKKAYEKCEKFLKSLPRDSLTRIYRFSGWELVRHQGNWDKD